MLESRAYSLDRMGIANILVMSGDYQTYGQAGLSMPVFDMDPVHILTAINLMNKGLRIKPDTRTVEETQKTAFFPGAVVSPFKFTEPGVMMQLFQDGKESPCRCGVSGNPVGIRFGENGRPHRIHEEKFH